MTVGLGAFSLAVIYWVGKPKKNLPPGPMGFPIIGSLLSLSKSMHNDLTRFGQKYGDVYSIHLGTQ